MGWRESRKLKRHNNKQTIIEAYTLAEMLIVMGILAIVMLSLPTLTKKVFKVEETRKPHGRFECYWDGDKLMSYYAEENGINVRHEYKEGEVDDEGNTVCKFDPPKNPVYLMIYAIGAGGAGAKIDNENTVTPPPVTNSITSYLYTSNPSNWPDWVNYIMGGDKPWGGASTFDVMKTSSQQVLHYRLGGSVGHIETLFVPQMEAGVTMEIIPGKGGAVSDNITSAITASGGNGEDTYVKFVRKSGETIERIVALLARGGAGGNGSIIGKVSNNMLGGSPGDMGLSDYDSVKAKESGFKEIGENIASSKFMESQIPYHAGNSGRGETQATSDTSGQVWYEWIKHSEQLGENSKRLGNEWINITENMNNFYKQPQPQYDNDANCSLASGRTVTERRDGYCTYRSGSSNMFDCTVGFTKDETDSGCSGDLTHPTPDCAHFTVTYDTLSKSASFRSTYFNGYSSCTFNFEYRQISCDKTLTNYAIHDCPMPASATAKCGTDTNAPEPEGDEANMKKCPATAGQHGAVVILW